MYSWKHYNIAKSGRASLKKRVEEEEEKMIYRFIDFFPLLSKHKRHLMHIHQQCDENIRKKRAYECSSLYMYVCIGEFGEINVLFLRFYCYWIQASCYAYCSIIMRCLGEWRSLLFSLFLSHRSRNYEFESGTSLLFPEVFCCCSCRCRCFFGLHLLEQSFENSSNQQWVTHNVSYQMSYK